eukprot:6210878-Pleurochrysis_carterae.AAC.2
MLVKSSIAERKAAAAPVAAHTARTRSGGRARCLQALRSAQAHARLESRQRPSATSASRDSSTVGTCGECGGDGGGVGGVGGDGGTGCSSRDTLTG